MIGDPRVSQSLMIRIVYSNFAALGGISFSGIRLKYILS